MATTTYNALTDAATTPREAVAVDKVANEVYSAHYSERKMSRAIISALSVMLIAAMCTIVSLAHKPTITRYVRIDEMGRAQAIQYSDLSYSPREGEVRTYLTDWTGYRYNVNQTNFAKQYPYNFYFLSQQLSSQLMTDDNSTHIVSQVTSGQIEQCEVDVKNVTITTMTEEKVQGATMAKGTALVTFDKTYSPSNSHDPRVEHWLISTTYYLNPKQVSEQTKLFPKFETINPLGLTITEFHENRLGVTQTVTNQATALPATANQTASIPNAQKGVGK